MMALNVWKACGARSHANAQFASQGDRRHGKSMLATGLMGFLVGVLMHIRRGGQTLMSGVWLSPCAKSALNCKQCGAVSSKSRA